MHEFTDFAMGKTPKGKLFLASNGKLYGTTVAGGDTVNGNVENGLGVLYEYDLILNKYRVVHYFNNLPSPYSLVGTSLIEPIIGKIYAGKHNKVFCYDIITETLTYLSSNINNSLIQGEFVKASNGFLYGTTYDTYCPTTNYIGQANYGTIIKINTNNNSVQQVFQLACDASEGIRFTGTMQEFQQGKLLGTISGGLNNLGTVNTENGLLFEFDINTNTFTKKIDFDGNNLGSYPNALVNSNNNKIYGVCQNGGSIPTPPSSFSDYPGTLFEYIPTTNTITKLHTFGQQNQNIESISGMHPYSIMKASTGDYFGISQIGLFKFNPITNEVIMPIPAFCQNGCPPQPLNAFVTESIIEICRKPSYREFTPDTFAPATGSAFTYDIQNTNATTYVWKKGNIVLPAQTTAVLNLPNITQADSGVYTCTMTNECGTTVTMNLFINVDNLSVSYDDYFKNKIKLYPNPTQNNLNIELPKNIDVTIKSIKIANSLGQLVCEQNNPNTTINVSQLQSGIYFINLTTNYGNWNGKFIKE
jgi:hypothetical protein